MGATLTAIQTGYANLVFAVAIEGWPDIITDGDPEAVYEAFQNANLPGLTDYTGCVGGLAIEWDQRQAITPWKPFGDPPALTFSVSPDIDSSRTVTDRFGEMVFRRNDGDETRLATTLDSNDTTTVVKSNTAFSASGILNIGPEAMSYTAKSGSTQFTTVTRGLYSPFHTQGDTRFARPHRAVDLSVETGDNLGVKISPRVTEQPRGLIGRHVMIWIIRAPAIRGAVGTLDVPDVDGHPAYAGVIRGVRMDDRGATVVSCEHMLRKVYETVLLRDQYRATVKSGIELTSDMYFTAYNIRDSTRGEAANLEVVASGATPPYEVNVGVYSASEIGEILTAWMAQAKVDLDLLFECSYAGVQSTSDGLRGVISYRDPTAAAATRSIWMTMPSPVARFLGWDQDGIGILNSPFQSVSKKGDSTPRRWAGNVQGEGVTLKVENPRGTYVDQRTFLPPALQHPVQLYTGILKVGDLGYVRAKQTDTSTFVCTSAGMSPFYEGNVREGLLEIPEGEDVELDVTQVLLLQGKFSDLILRILVSTGTSGFNHTADTFAEQVGCGIPWTALDNGNGVDDISTDIAALPCADLSLCVAVDAPTRLVELLAGQFQARLAFFCWGNGRIRLRSWSTPVADYAQFAIGEEDKAVPVGQAESDKQRTLAEEVFETIANIVKFKADVMIGGVMNETISIVDAESVEANGARVQSINLRNAISTGPVADDVTTLISYFSEAMRLFSVPWWRLKRTLAPTKWETAVLGTQCTLTDRHVRNPDNGTRWDHRTSTGGLSVWPGLVVASRLHWGGPAVDGGQLNEMMGDVELMVLPRITNAAYCPSGTVDHTSTNSGYVVATKILTLTAHSHSENSHSADAASFPATSVVKVYEFDPDDPATTLVWTDTVASQTGNTVTLTTGLGSPAFDNTRRYRITFANYGSATATQQAKTFQADDADGRVADARSPYGLIYSGSGQLGVYTASVAEVAPGRYTATTYGDGVAVDCGTDKDCAELATNMVGYKQAIQCPIVYTTARTFGGSGTRELIETFPIAVQCGRIPTGQTRKIYVSPLAASTSGTSHVYVTVSRVWPNESDRNDVTFVEPYVQADFSTSSATQAILTEQGIDIRHLDLGDGPFSGIAWVSVEITANAVLHGLSHIDLGPLESA